MSKCWAIEWTGVLSVGSGALVICKCMSLPMSDRSKIDSIWPSLADLGGSKPYFSMLQGQCVLCAHLLWTSSRCSRLSVAFRGKNQNIQSWVLFPLLEVIPGNVCFTRGGTQICHRRTLVVVVVAVVVIVGVVVVVVAVVVLVAAAAAAAAAAAPGAPGAAAVVVFSLWILLLLVVMAVLSSSPSPSPVAFPSI